MARPISAIVLLLSAMPALAGETRMVVQDGLVSATFDATPAPEALDVIRRATGVKLVLPPAVEPKRLTLVVDQVPLEAFLHRVLVALDLAGFALVYAPDGAADRLIAVPPDHERPPPVTATRSGMAAADARRPTAPRRVPFLIRQAEAESIKLGSPGQTILPESRPSFTTATEACDGTLAEYPVQTVLIVSAGTTHVATLIVCAPEGLTPGDALVPRAPPATRGREVIRPTRATRPGPRSPGGRPSGGPTKGVMDEPRVRLFVMGENRWRTADDYPLPGTRATPWYLRDGGVLTVEPPSGAERADELPALRPEPEHRRRRRRGSARPSRAQHPLPRRPPPLADPPAGDRDVSDRPLDRAGPGPV